MFTRTVSNRRQRPAGPVVPERFAVLQALLAYLLAACGEQNDAVIPAHEIVDTNLQRNIDDLGRWRGTTPPPPELARAVR